MSMIKRIIKSIIALLIAVTSLSYSWIEVKADDDNSIAYAILTEDNDLIFFRSFEQYSEGSNTTVTDINNSSFSGVVITGIEDTTYSINKSLYIDRLERVYVADNTIIRPKNMALMFYNCENLVDADMRGFDTTEVISMKSLFNGCKALNRIDISSFDTSGADMDSFLRNCPMLTEMVLGKGIVNWWRLPSGNWTNAELGITLSADDLYNQYPSHTKDWAGTWKRDITEIEDIDLENIVVKTGDNKYVYREISPEDSNSGLAWTSSDESIFTVDSYGYVTGVSLGEGYLTVKSVINPEVYATAHVRVVDSYAYGVLKEDGELVFIRSYDKYENQSENSITDVDGNTYYGIVYDGVEDYAGFSINNRRQSVKKVSVEKNAAFYPLYMRSWFVNCIGLSTVDLNGFDTTYVKDYTNLFGYSNNLETIDISSFNTSNAESMDYMFFKNDSLSSVTLGNGFSKWIDDAHLPEAQWTNGEITKSETELYNEYPSHASEWAGTWTRVYSDIQSVDLGNIVVHVGDVKTINKTVVPEDANGKMQWSSSDENIFTVDSVGNITGISEGEAYVTAVSVANPEICVTAHVKVVNSYAYAVLNTEGNLIFCRSNDKINNLDSTTVNATNGEKYTGIVFNGVEDNNRISIHMYKDQIKKVYVADNTVIYPVYLRGWFEMCSNVTDIDLRGFDTEYVEQFDYLVDYCYSLKKIDLSTFNTANAISMSYMFIQNNSLEEIALGTGFSKWLDNSYLPQGYWRNGELAKTETELYNEYPSHASEWAGTWVKRFVPVEEILLGNLNSIKINETATIEVNVLPEDADDKTLLWTSSDESIVKVDRFGVLTGISEGKGVITASAMDGSGVSASIEVNVIGPTAYAVLLENGDLIFVRSLNDYENGNNTTLSDINGNQYSGIVFTDVEQGYNNWSAYNEEIKKVYVAENTTISISSMGYWFNQCSALTEFDSTGMDTKTMTNMSGLFNDCSSLTKADLSSFNTANVTSMWNAFDGCNNLKEITFGTEFNNWVNESYLPTGAWMHNRLDLTKTAEELYDEYPSNSQEWAGTWKKADVIAEDVIVYNLTLVEGEKRSISKYFTPTNVSCLRLNWSSSNEEVASIDENGLVTAHGIGTATITASTIDGSDITVTATVNVYENKAYAVLTNNGELIFFRSNQTYECYRNTEVIDINGNRFTGIVFDDVENGKYGWGNYNSKIKKVSVAPGNTIHPVRMDAWFELCTNLVEFNAEGFDTTNTTSMISLFNKCDAIENLDLHFFDTHNVTAMSKMFCDCRRLLSLDISGFDTSNVSKMNNMFPDNLIEVKLSPLFTTWTDMAKLPAGNWINGEITATADDLYYTYPANANSWSGTWKREIIPATEISISTIGTMQKGIIPVGKTDYFYTIVKPYNATVKVYHYSSSDETIASVDTKGNITGLRPGQVTITVTTIDGSDLSRTIDLTVIDTVAYAVLTDDGDLIFIRSSEFYNSDSYQTITDLNGQQYTGTVYPYIEYFEGGISVNPPWYNERSKIIRSYVAENTVIKPICLSRWFVSCDNLEEFSFEGFDTSLVDSMAHMFEYCRSLKTISFDGLDTSNLDSVSAVLGACESLESVEFGNFDTSNVTNFSGMLYGCSSLKEVDLKSLDTSKATNMQAMFQSLSSVKELDLSNFNTQNVELFYWMFYGCTSLEKLDISSFNTDKATKMEQMFYQCPALKEVKLGNGFTVWIDSAKLTEGYWYDGSRILTATELYDQYPSNHDDLAGTWTRLTQITKLELDKNNTEIRKGHQEQLTVTITPDDASIKDLVWSSSDESVVTVDEKGMLYGVNPGHAIITVSSTDRSGAKRQCSVYVKEYVYLGIVFDENNNAKAQYKDNKYNSTAFVDATVNSVTTYPTCTDDGQIVYTAFVSATDSLDDREHTQSKTVVLPATGHDYGEPEYVWSKDNSSVTANVICNNDVSHVISETKDTVYHVTIEPDCETAGTGVYTVQFENENFSEQTKEIVLEKLGHIWKFTEWVWSENNGSAEAYFTCERNENHTNNVEVISTVVETKPHCEEDGETVYTVVLNKDESPDNQQHTDTKTIVVKATGHDYGEPEYIWSTDNSTVTATMICNNDNSHVITETQETLYEVKKDPTCEEDGIAEYSVHFDNDAFIDQKKEIKLEKLGHDWRLNSWNWTDDYNSATAVFECNNCHRLDNLEVLSTVIYTEPKCETEGGYTYTVSISSSNSPDGKYHEDNRKIVEQPIGHKYGAAVYTWSDDYSEITAIVKCQHDESHVITETKKTSRTLLTEPDCVNKGKYLYTAVFDNTEYFTEQSETVDIPELGHLWKYVEMKWVDLDTASITYVCERAESHSQTLSVKANATVITPVTCESEGKSTFTATVSENESLDHQEHSISKNVILPATGHDYSIIRYTWSTDNSSVLAEAICSHNDSHVISEQRTSSSEITIQPACETAGNIRYSVVFANTEYFTNQTKDVEIAPLGHDWKFTGFDFEDITAGYRCATDTSHLTNIQAVKTTVIDPLPTCENTGVENITLTVDSEHSLDHAAHSQTVNNTVPATGHDYEASWSWNGYTSAVATLICKNDKTHRVTKNAEITTETIREATYTEQGLLKHTAVVVHDGIEYLDVKEETIGFLVSVSSITLSNTEATVEKGSTFTITATVLPNNASNKKLVWTSSNPEVATVDENGVVTTVSVGSVLITATAADGSSITASCHVTVKGLPTDGNQYAVLTAEGDLIFLRSFEQYTNKQETTVIDINGRKYQGIVYLINNGYYETKYWLEKREEIKRVYVADETVIVPVYNMNNWFSGCYNLESFDSSGFDTSNVTNMSGLFSECQSLKKLDLTGFETENVTDMSNMFSNCWRLEDLDISTFSTLHIGYMYSMFEDCHMLQTVTLGTGFTQWINSAYLPEGNWSHGDMIKTEKQLYNAYPTYTSEWAGTWARTITKAESLELYKNKTVLEIGDNIHIDAVLYPDNVTVRQLVWSCSDTSIATIDSNGYLTALKNGEVIIKAETIDGSELQAEILVRILDSYAYAVLQNNGNLVFVRSSNRYENLSNGSLIATNGKTYTGVIFDSIENKNAYYASENEWFTEDYVELIKKAFVAENTMIYPASMTKMFANCINMESFDAKGFDTSETVAMNDMFNNCRSLKYLDLSQFNTQLVSTYTNMFRNCHNLETLDISSFDNRNIYSMNQMFSNCNSLKSVKLGNKFTVWQEGAQFPVGNWSNGSLIKNETELQQQYPENADLWCGTWTRKVVKASSIDIVPDTYVVSINEYFNLEVVILPSEASTKDWEFVSSDNKIVDVYGKSFNPKKPGTVTITAITVDGTALTDTCTVIVVGYTYEQIRWTDDYKAYAVYHDVLNDKDVELEMTVAIETIDATCTKPGQVLYKAEISAEESLDGKGHGSTKSVDYQALGHSYSEWKYDGESLKTHTHVCANDPNHTETQPCEFDEGVTEGDITTYTCKICGGTYSVKEEGPVNPEVDGVIRVAGANRFGTSQAIASVYKLNNNVEKLDAVILANGDNFADALAGSYLAAEKNAPIIITRVGKEAEVNAYIRSILNKGGTIYVLGGTAAVPESCLNGLTGKGYDIKRLWGSNRYLTNLDILNHVGIKGDRILVATGNVFADSLSASATGLPMLLVRDDGLTDQQKEFLSQNKGKEFIILGGNNAVKPIIESQLKSYGSVRRIMGANRAGTSIEIAKEFFPEAKQAVVAYSHNFPDGLCGGPLAHQVNAPLILTRDNDADATAAYLKSKGISNGYVLGGTSVLSDALVRKLYAMRSSDKIIIFE